MRVAVIDASSKGWMLPTVVNTGQVKQFTMTFSNTGTAGISDTLKTFMVFPPAGYSFTGAAVDGASSDSWGRTVNSRALTITAAGAGLAVDGYVRITLTANTPLTDSAGAAVPWTVKALAPVAGTITASAFHAGIFL